MNNKWLMGTRWAVLCILCVFVLAVPSGILTATASVQSPWWVVEPEQEKPSSHYDSILYSEIPAKLHEIEMNSNRVKVEVIGQSAGGRNLFLVTLSDPQSLGRLGHYQQIRRLMLSDPEAAQELIDRLGDFKVPVFINASIHGTEYPGVDAAIRLIETLAYEDTPEVQAILDSVILLVNVVQNPDGRVLGTRANANGFDVNRDFITQSQPETLATVGVITEWNPMVILDLHGFVNPMLIEPCTPPHNPNYEYDLYISWALAEAEAMEAELFAQTGFQAQIPYRDDPLGWDDWPPTYTPMYGMYHGGYGHTLETPFEDERGVDAHYAAVWGALNFVAANKEGMIHDQIEIFRRGYLGLLQQPIPPELLPAYPQYLDLMIQEFPAAYVIPQTADFQTSPHQVARLIDFMILNDVQVHQASETFTLDGVEYPAGTYVVWLTQPKRGLANTILDAGLDLSDIPGLYFYSPPSVWSHPYLWGVYRAVMEEALPIATHEIEDADPPQGSLEGTGTFYAYYPTSIASIQATNDLLAEGALVRRAPVPFVDGGRDLRAGAIIVPGDGALVNRLVNDYALDLLALGGIPSEAVVLREQRIAAAVDTGGLFLLDRFGFDYDVIDGAHLSLDGYDVFINNSLLLGSLGKRARTEILEFFAQGGDYIGLGDYGADLAQEAELLAFDILYPPGNSIVNVNYDPADGLSAGFAPDGYAFINYAAVFDNVGTDVVVAATVDDDSEFLVSGFWPGWQASGAAGLPLIIHNTGGVQDTTLIGLDATYRAHPEDAFRLVANAIYGGLE